MERKRADGSIAACPLWTSRLLSSSAVRVVGLAYAYRDEETGVTTLHQ
jgi:hypothetical protein